jgi:UDPglucose 6-dehydrogenase
VLDVLEDRTGPLRGRRVALLGLTFKPGTDDLRNSPAINLATAMLARGAEVTVHDPVATDTARPLLGPAVTYAADPMAAIEEADVVAIGAGWPQWRALDWAEVARRMRGDVLFDARNALGDLALPEGLRRIGIGRGKALALGE